MEKDDDDVDEEDKKEVDDDNYNDKEEDDVSVVQAGPWLRIMHTVLQVLGMPARIWASGALRRMFRVCAFFQLSGHWYWC